MAPRGRARQGLAHWLRMTRIPVFVLDDRRAILFFNPSCESLTGWRAEELIGKVCAYAAEPDPRRVESVTGPLCPPPEVVSGRTQVVPAHFVHRDGQPLGRLIHFHPLPDAETGRLRILGLITAADDADAPRRTTPAQELHAELAEIRTTLRTRYQLERLVCRTAAMQRVREQLGIARAAGTAVHLCGEKGSGREYLARLIHAGGTAGDLAFVPLDCRRLTIGELQSTLHRALNPAVASATLAAAAATPGTLFLRDVASLPRDLQQFIVEHYRAPPADSPRLPRLMSSEAHPLQAALEAETLIAECFYLLTPLTIDVPPLRDRQEDLPLLVQSLLEEMNRCGDKQLGGVTDETLTLLRQYRWPENVAELAAVIQEAHAASTSPLITPRDLPFRFRTGIDAQAVGPPLVRQPRPLEPYLAQVEAEQIRLALQQCKSNKSEAAALLGLTRARLYRRMEALGIAE